MLRSLISCHGILFYFFEKAKIMPWKLISILTFVFKKYVSFDMYKLLQGIMHLYAGVEVRTPGHLTYSSLR